jgi:PIN domain nuclease of toxin-antitoxin system
LLLHPHLLVWPHTTPQNITNPPPPRLDASEVFASAASIWEISIKSALGKLEADPNEILAGVEPAGFNHLPIVGEHAAKVKELPPIHKDPFDRLLVAQARFEPMILLTDDEVLGGYGEFVEVV